MMKRKSIYCPYTEFCFNSYIKTIAGCKQKLGKEHLAAQGAQVSMSWPLPKLTDWTQRLGFQKHEQRDYCSFFRLEQKDILF